MRIKRSAVAGTLESSDIMVTLEPQATGIDIDLESVVEKQFGDEIRGVIQATLQDMDVQGVRVRAVDKGALNFVIRARVQTAVCRSTADEAP